MSIVSWMEIMCGAEGPEEQAGCREFLATFMVHPLTPETAEEAVRLRRERRLRLPYVIVWATARVHGRPAGHPEHEIFSRRRARHPCALYEVTLEVKLE